MRRCPRLEALLLPLWLGCGDPSDEAPALPAIEAAELEQLAQLGYGDWSGRMPSATLEQKGVVHAVPERCFTGYNLYTSLPSREAHLLDMRGEVVHTWTQPPGDGDPWHHVELADDGGLFALANGPLQKLDRHSRPIWQAPIKAHHDLDVGPDGRIHVLGSRLRYLGERKLPIIDDEIVVLEPDGTLVRRIPFSELLPDAISEATLDAIEAFLKQYDLASEQAEAMLARTGSPVDVFHANSIELLPRDVARLGRAGSALVTLRSLDRVSVIDLERGVETWSFGPGVLERPHHARLLRNGRISVFDNGWFREGSRVLRVSRGGKPSWQYPAEPGLSFFTRRRGAAQHLPNGNVLITESARGRVFEIAPDGEIVWEFLNPETDRESRRRAQLYRMQRLSPDRVAPLLAVRGEAVQDAP